MIRFRHPLVAGLVLGGTLLSGWAACQVPDASPPAIDVEGTEASWDLTNPGWRDWRNRSDDDSAQVQTLKKKQQEQQRQLADARQKQEEAQKKQREEEQRRRQLEQYWQQVQAQQQRRQEAERQRAFEQAKQTLLVNFQVPPPPTMPPSPAAPASQNTTAWSDYGQVSFGQTPVASRGSAAGLSASQWQQARQYQGLIETLHQSVSVSPDDEAILDRAEVRRNTLWTQAVQVPALPDDAREALVLRLPVTLDSNVPAPEFTAADLDALEQKEKQSTPAADAAVTDMLSDLYVDKSQELVTQGGKTLAINLLGKEAAGHFGNVLGVAKIAMVGTKGGAAGVASATMNMVIGKIPIPQATVGLTGGRIYANVAYEAMNRFMRDCTKVTGVETDIDAFWRDLKDQMTVGQKAVMEFVTYGPKK